MLSLNAQVLNEDIHNPVYSFIERFAVKKMVNVNQAVKPYSKREIADWLKKPALGMTPLFMAGDKFFFYYAHKIKKQLGIDLEIWGVNELENTNFKTGFSGLAPQFDKKHIEDTIINNYDWEKAVDTNSTWRIGDGTASFYNYIYTLIVGFSENDTFRSNQIREGMITREQGLKLIYEENKPRYNSLKWYLEIIGLDYESVIKTINKIPRRY